MGRLVLILVIAFVVYLLIRGFMRKQVKRDEAEVALRAKSNAGEDMVTCASCGVNLPRSEAHAVAGRLVCADNPRCTPPG